MYSFRIERRLCTISHSHTDGQTERQKRVLKQYWRSYANDQQDDWAPILAVAEFVSNLAVHSSTCNVPFEIVYAEVTRLDMLILDKVQKYSAIRGSTAEDESLIERICATCKEVTKFLVHAQAYQARIYNQSHCNIVYKIG